MYTKREAATTLGIDRNTLDKWLQVCGITPKRDPRDKRLCLLSDDDVLTLREHYAESHRAFNGASVHLYVSSADLAARLTELERIVADLQQRLTANLASRVELPAYVPQRRLTATTASHSRTPARPPLPTGMMSLPTWWKLHKLRDGTVKGWRERKLLPVERGQWLEDGVRIDTALTSEGRRIAHQLAGIAWPCEHCTLEEGQEEETNETPHTPEV